MFCVCIILTEQELSEQKACLLITLWCIKLSAFENVKLQKKKTVERYICPLHVSNTCDNKTIYMKTVSLEFVMNIYHTI